MNTIVTSPRPGLPDTITFNSATDGPKQLIAEVKKFDPHAAWILYFISGNNVHPKQKVFCSPGTIRDVVDRAKSHCTNMNFRFLRVEPWLSDLDHDERFINRQTGE